MASLALTDSSQLTSDSQHLGIYSSPMASLALTDSSQLTSDSQHLAKILLDNLKARPSLSESLLKEDVAESLAETMTKIHAPFLSYAVQCFEILIDDPKFFSGSHAVYVSECLLRTANTLLRLNKPTRILSPVVGLIADIFHRFSGALHCEKVFDSIFDVRRVLSTVNQMLCAPGHVEKELIVTAGYLLSSVVNHRLSNALWRVLADTVKVCLTKISTTLTSINPYKETDAMFYRTVIVMSNIASSTIVSFSSIDYDEKKDQTTPCDPSQVEVYRELQRDIFSFILDFTLSTLTCYVVDEGMISSPTKMYTSYLILLENMLKRSHTSLDHFKLSSGLANRGFLDYLLKLADNWAGIKKDGWLSELCLFILGELLYDLSAQYLKLGNTDSSSLFRTSIHQGVREFLSSLESFPDSSALVLPLRTLHFRSDEEFVPVFKALWLIVAVSRRYQGRV
uniref:(California timema) hypothetical protein n=1 Tax=Timema californicum TaxID=61474 RepID=A0A7R9PCX9_TIMCA|nr:unnamed protein product [Timema californicum]